MILTLYLGWGETLCESDESHGSLHPENCWFIQNVAYNLFLSHTTLLSLGILYYDPHFSDSLWVFFKRLIDWLIAMLGLSFCSRAFSSCGKRGPLFIAVRGPLTIVASLVAEHRLQTRRLSSCGSRAQSLRGMWDPPRPGHEPVSPALAPNHCATREALPLAFYSYYVFNFQMFFLIPLSICTFESSTPF